MSPKKESKVTPLQIEPKAARRKGLQSFSALVPDQEQFRFIDHPDETFYIVKLESKPSDKYGVGYLVHVKDMPNAVKTMKAGVYGSIPAAQLDALYQATKDGTRISLDSPVPVKIEAVQTKNGPSYKFVDPFAK